MLAGLEQASDADHQQHDPEPVLWVREAECASE
jgi:hypothetical protein